MPANDRFHAWVPFALVFAAGTSVMVIELVAARLVARHVGSSLYTWTAIIGVVLAGITLGNWLGGILADRVPRQRVQEALSALFAAASLCAFSILWTHWHVFELPGSWNWPLRIVTGSMLAFFLPAVLLGAISPVVATWAVLHSRALGHTLGGLYAWGSLGAIAGTLLAGFVLIPFLGTITVVASVGLVLAAIGVTLCVRAWSLGWFALAAGLTLVSASAWPWATGLAERIGLRPPSVAIYFDESAYQAIEVHGDRFGVRGVLLDGLYHGYVDPARPEVLHYAYLDVFRAVIESREDPAGGRPASLLLGGGSYTFPRWLVAAYPRGRTVVAEIDPAVTFANQVATDLPREPGFDIIHRDARLAVMELLDAGERFDYIVGDAFQERVVPAHLTTLEFHRQLRALLEGDGILIVNVIDVFARGRFLGAYVNTVASVFEHVAVFATFPVGDGGHRDTFVVVASPAPLDASRVRAAATTRHVPVYPLSDAQYDTLLVHSRGLVLTDDHAPVDYLMGDVMLQSLR